ncbi:hypothetical protein ASG47_07180 [Devosia sp. Leaf420]|uniref:site-specific integrase n=1 Tax=Devosia sp. Leaf420 TaxID=1736374 RepID=UPI000713D68B|nr:site-specific integrase [Devosia sp. Leaf420]KQT48149.1 hypothetical protein ASG47_07180 [Devosia sp. Leaf420]
MNSCPTSTRQIAVQAVKYDKSRSKLKWVVRYRDGWGDPKRKSFRFRPEAVAFRKALLAAAKSIPDGLPTTLAQAGQKFSASIRAKNRHTAIESVLRLHIYPVFGDTWLHEIDAEFHRRVEAFIESRSFGSHRKHVARTAFEGTLSFAEKRGWLPHGRSTYAKARPAQTPCLIAWSRLGKHRVMPTIEEVNLMLDGVEDWLRVPVFLALRAGLRIGEILALRWCDVDFKRGLIEVRSSEPIPYPDTRTDAVDDVRHPPKTRSGHRFVRMTKKLKEVLRWWRREVVADRESKVVFRPSSKRPGPLNRSKLSGELLELQVRLGIATRNVKQDPVTGFSTRTYPGHYSFHQLRHAYVALNIWAGVPEEEISSAVGHKNVKVTVDMYGYLIQLRREGGKSWPNGRVDSAEENTTVSGQSLVERHGRTYRVHQPIQKPPAITEMALAA